MIRSEKHMFIMVLYTLAHHFERGEIGYYNCSRRGCNCALPDRGKKVGDFGGRLNESAARRASKVSFVVRLRQSEEKVSLLRLQVEPLIEQLVEGVEDSPGVRPLSEDTLQKGTNLVMRESVSEMLGAETGRRELTIVSLSSSLADSEKAEVRSSLNQAL